MTSYLSLSELGTGRLTQTDGSVCVCIPRYEFRRPLQDALAAKTTYQTSLKDALIYWPWMRSSCSGLSAGASIQVVRWGIPWGHR